MIYMKPISRIDVSKNKLFFRGFDVTELSRKYGFEEVLYLLMNAELPSNNELHELAKKLVELRRYYTDETLSLEELARNLDRIRSENQLSLEDILLTFVSLAPLVVANRFGILHSRRIEKPDSSLGHAANFLWMMKGKIPIESDIKDFETSLILHMDDPTNPSLSALNESFLEGGSPSNILLSALSSHIGPLHHGAGTEAMKMFEEMRDVNNPRKYLEERVDSGRKIFGLGHRIYRANDPRAVVLGNILQRRAVNTSDSWLLEIIEQVVREGHAILKERKGIDAYPNVDLYNAAVYSTFEFPPELNTELFAISRASGWIAHLIELHNTQL